MRMDGCQDGAATRDTSQRTLVCDCQTETKRGRKRKREEMEFGYCCSENIVGRESPLAMVSSWNERRTERDRERERNVLSIGKEQEGAFA